MNKEYIMNNINEYNIQYKDNIGIPHSQNFGIEIETEEMKITKFKKELKKHERLSKWQTKRDSSLYLSGLEIVSPILIDEKKTWNMLKELCELLKEYKANPNRNSSLQIHYDAKIFSYYWQYLDNFYKLWSIYENVIYKYCYGVKGKPRSNITKYADMSAKKILRAKKGCEYYYEGYNLLYDKNGVLEENILNYSRIFGNIKTNSFSFRYNIFEDELVPRTIELRPINGTIDEVLIQSYIKFFYKFINYCCSENFDSEFINTLYNNMDVLDNVIYNSTIINIDKALEFVSLFLEEEDIMDFMKIYLNKNDKKRTRNI